MAIFKRGRIYWYHFVFNGKHVQESTKQGNPRAARQMEAAHRTALAKGEVGIREKRPIPTLAEFLRGDFLPYVQSKHAPKPATVRYYETGASALLASDLASLQLDQITDQHAGPVCGTALTPVTFHHQLRTKNPAPGNLSRGRMGQVRT